MDTEGACGSKNLDETVRQQYERTEDWMREVIGKRLQKAEVAHPVWLADQPRR